MPVKSVLTFITVCIILRKVGESEAEVLARREAAREMYNLLSDGEYKDAPYAIGKCCRRASELTAAGFQQVMSDYVSTVEVFVILLCYF